MKDSVSIAMGVVQLVVVIGGFGFALGEQSKANQAQAERLDKMEDQILVWLDDAEKQEEANHREVMTQIDVNRRKIGHTNNFLIRKYPEYQTYD